jgi:uncharacterized protein
MQLDLTRFRQPVTHVARQFTPAQLAEANEPGEAEAYRVVGPVDLEFDLHKDKNRFRVVGRLRAELELPCSRCLEPFRLPVDVPLDLRYAPATELDAEEPADEDRDVSKEDVDTSYYRDDVLDLDELLREQFYLALPMKPLCTEGCLGLCPECGANQNTAPCGCQPTWEDPRLAPLKKLVDRSKEH